MKQRELDDEIAVANGMEKALYCQQIVSYPRTESSADYSSACRRKHPLLNKRISGEKLGSRVCVQCHNAST